MILSVEVPELGMGVIGGSVTKWHVAEGGAIAFGDVLCEIEARESEAVDRTKDASRLLRRRRTKSEQTRTVKLRLRFRIIASEPGTMRSIELGEGSPFRVGDVLAHVAPEFGDNGGSPDSTSKMRVVAEVMDRTAEEL